MDKGSGGCSRTAESERGAGLYAGGGSANMQWRFSLTASPNHLYEHCHRLSITHIYRIFHPNQIYKLASGNLYSWNLIVVREIFMLKRLKSMFNITGFLSVQVIP